MFFLFKKNVYFFIIIIFFDMFIKKKIIKFTNHVKCLFYYL